MTCPTPAAPSANPDSSPGSKDGASVAHTIVSSSPAEPSTLPEKAHSPQPTSGTVAYLRQTTPGTETSISPSFHIAPTTVLVVLPRFNRRPIRLEARRRRPSHAERKSEKFWTSQMGGRWGPWDVSDHRSLHEANPHRSEHLPRWRGGCSGHVRRPTSCITVTSHLRRYRGDVAGNRPPRWQMRAGGRNNRGR